MGLTGMIDWDKPYECEGQLSFNDTIIPDNDEVKTNDDEIPPCNTEE